jgi:serine/threonine-protein kinase PknK
VPGWSRNRSAPVAPAEEQISGYHDLHRIGHGGFSVVYRARQAGIDRVVALKVLRVEFVDAQIKRRFLREVQLTGRLSAHPNVVTVFDSGLTGAGRPYIAMDLYERGSLRDRLLASGPLPLAEALRVGVKIAGALDAAHREGIVHRDVKPQNILVSRYGEPALADFGTARLVAEIDASARTEALTPFHAAPEVLEGKPPTAASDVYSLGSTLYQLLAGRAAFQRDGDFGIAPLLLRIVSEEPPPLRGVPPAAEAVILRAMHRDPECRYGTAAELLGALQGLQRGLGLPVAETPGGSPPDETDFSEPEFGERELSERELGEPELGETPPELADDASDAGPVPGLPSIAATEWEFGEKTGYRTGQPREFAADRSGADMSGARPQSPFMESADPEVMTAGPGTGRGTGPGTGRGTGPERRPRTMTFAAAGALVIIAIAVPLALAGARGGTPRPAPSAHHTGTAGAPTDGLRTASTAPASAAPPDPAARDAAPTGLTVTVAGPTATLRWKLTAGNNYPLIVDQPSTGVPPASLAAGTTSYTVIGLHPGTEYCFKVGALTADSSQAATFQWSNVACAAG